MKLLSLIFAFALCFAVVTADKAWELCSKDPSKDIMQIIDITFAPNPVKCASNFQASFNATLTKDVEDALGSLLVYAGNIKIFDQSVDICQSFGDKIKCPMKAGPFNFDYQLFIPQLACNFPSNLHGAITVLDTNMANVTCVDFHVTLAK